MQGKRAVSDWLNAEGVHYLILDARSDTSRTLEARLKRLVEQGATVIYQSANPLGLGPRQAVLWAFRPNYSVNVQFGRSLLLIGYHAITTERGNSLLFHWYTQHPTNVAYTMFVHVLDANTGSLVGQADTPLGEGVRPTNTWRQNEPVFESVDLPADLLKRTTRPFHVRVGLYAQGDGQRALIENKNQTFCDDHIDITLP